MMNIFHSKSRSRFMGAILGMAALMTIFGFSGVYAGDLLVYTALEDDETGCLFAGIQAGPSGHQY